MGGAKPSEGMVQVELAGAKHATGAVCLGKTMGAFRARSGPSLAQRAAAVVCRQLGFTGAARAVANKEAFYNSTATGLSPVMVVQASDCIGSEARLQECTMSSVVNPWPAAHLENDDCWSHIHDDDCMIENALAVECNLTHGEGGAWGEQRFLLCLLSCGHQRAVTSFLPA